MLSLDPSLSDSSMVFDAPGFDIEIGQTSTTGAIDLDDSDGFDSIQTDQNLATDWATWRFNGARDFRIRPADPVVFIDEDDTLCTNGLYCGTAASRWWDFHERMWHLLNLVRVLNNDSLVEDFRDGVPLDGPSLDHLGGDTIETLRV